MKRWQFVIQMKAIIGRFLQKEVWFVKDILVAARTFPELPTLWTFCAHFMRNNLDFESRNKNCCSSVKKQKLSLSHRNFDSKHIFVRNPKRKHAQVKPNLLLFILKFYIQGMKAKTTFPNVSWIQIRRFPRRALFLFLPSKVFLVNSSTFS